MVPASSELSKRIEMTAFAPISVAFLTSRSRACRRVSSRSEVYSFISPPPMDRRPAIRLPEKPRLLAGERRRSVEPARHPRLAATVGAWAQPAQCGEVVDRDVAVLPVDPERPRLAVGMDLDCDGR